MAVTIGDRVALRSRPKPPYGNGAHYRNGHANGLVTILASSRRTNGDVFQHRVEAKDGCKFWIAPWEIDTEG